MPVDAGMPTPPRPCWNSTSRPSPSCLPNTCQKTKQRRQRWNDGNTAMKKVGIIDSHTAGEPTRLVIDGGPDLGEGSLDQRLRVFRERFDWFRSGVVNE